MTPEQINAANLNLLSERFKSGVEMSALLKSINDKVK